MTKIKHFNFFKLLPRYTSVAALIGVGCLIAQKPAYAHHSMGGNVPSNFFEGFLSGLAHPLIGLDHFAFVIAIGLLAVGQVQGALIPAGFVLAAMVGTGIHLLSVDLPATEIIIAVSAIAFGAMLVKQNKPNWILQIVLGAIAGLFHGYAYGEAIIGAGMTPLFAYLLGFTLIQYGVAFGAFRFGSAAIGKFNTQPLSFLQLAGLAISSIGVVFLASSIS